MPIIIVFSALRSVRKTVALVVYFVKGFMFFLFMRLGGGARHTMIGKYPNKGGGCDESKLAMKTA